MAKNEYHEHLRAIPLFADLDKKELDSVVLAATELDFAPGKVLVREGDRAHEMYVVVEGTVTVTQDGSEVAQIGPGGFFGEMAMLTNSHRNSTVTTATDATVLHIDGRAFSSLLRNAPMIAVKMLPIVAARVVANSDHHSH